MKRNLIGTLSLVVMSVLFNVNGAYAQAAAHANVPFAFSVGSAHLPAGRYSIALKDPNLGVIMLGNTRTGVSVLSVGQPEYSHGKTWKLVFQQVGNQYFLTHIWGAPGSVGMKLQAPKPHTKLEIASKRSPSANNVEIALK